MTDTSITRIPTTDDATYAFEIAGKISRAEMEAMGEEMNIAFDLFDKVNMVLVFKDFDGSELGAGFDWASLTSRARALKKVDKYVAVGAPSGAARMIEALGKVIPVDAKAFDLADVEDAWDFVGARPQTGRMSTQDAA